MRLSTFSDYSLRVLMYLACQSDRLATIVEISQAHGVSKNHLMKVVHQLGRNGYIETVRGKHGGIRLARASSEINLRDVVSDMENVSCLLDCQREGCLLTAGCRFQGILRKAMRAFLDVLGEFTLADLVKDKDRMCGLLGLQCVDRIL